MNFGDFLNSIFYVGRGVGSRFMDHMREAQLILNNNYEDFDEEYVSFSAFNGFMSLFEHPKEARILNIWKDGPVDVLIVNLDNFAEKTILSNLP
jgi:hypothetical protein